MNCVNCIYRTFFKYAFHMASLLVKNIRNIIAIKSASFRLILLKYAFMGKKYHSPLMPLAAVMVNAGMGRFPLFDRPHLKCVVETNSCLIDIVEKLTHCNRVNGRLKIYDYGRYALTFYDSEDLHGVRVFVDTEKLKRYSGLLYRFFVKSEGSAEYDSNEVFFEAAGKASKVITFKEVLMAEEFRGRGTGVKKWGVCPSCGEPGHLYASGGVSDAAGTCIACRDAKLYRP